MKKITVKVDKQYDILINRGLINDVGTLVKSVSSAKKICVISDTNVFPLYGRTVVDSLQNAQFDVINYVFKAGEESKKTSTVIEMVEFLAENELTRSDLVVALGGGVCGDMAGFASAIYLRGIDFVQIPTTLLSQVDSSVGGKTAVDLPQGKNLCGAFWQPKLVIIDPDLLDSLSDHFFSDGLAEAIKMGCIKSKTLFERFENEDAKSFIEDIIFECVDLKRGVVERDEKEHGERALLNFGHTSGHAIEKLYDFKGISHGEAVGIGMVIICEVCEKNGITKVGCAKRIANVLEKNNLKTTDKHQLKEIVEQMSNDKKRTDNGIKFIVLDDIGESKILPVKYDEIAKMFGVD